jgi:hypothetical protein
MKLFELGLANLCDQFLSKSKEEFLELLDSTKRSQCFMPFQSTVVTRIPVQKQSYNTNNNTEHLELYDCALSVEAKDQHRYDPEVLSAMIL